MARKASKLQEVHEHATPTAAGLAASENDEPMAGEPEESKEHLHVSEEGYEQSENAAGDVPAQHGYSKDRDALLKRLRRVEGQVRGVQGMVESDRYCIDIVTQITAVQAALDKVALEILEDHTRHCLVGAETKDQAELTEELMSSVRRLLRHG